MVLFPQAGIGCWIEASTEKNAYQALFTEKSDIVIVHGVKIRYTIGMTEKKKPSQRFAARRDVWMRNLLMSDVPSGAKVVAIRLALYMNEKKQWAHPGHDKLGQDCGFSARNVRDHIEKLEDEKWLLVKHVRNAGNTYWLRYWWDE